MNLEPLDVDRIQRGIARLETPFTLIYFPEVDSTNRVAATLPGVSFRPGTAVLTDFQSAGRGRRDRSWMAPPCTGLLMSLVFEMPPVPGDALLLMTLAVGDALRSTGVDSHIKWPNDILIEGRKVCGILAERVVRDAAHFVVVGCGINVSCHPDLPGAGSVAEAVRASVNRADLAVQVFTGVDRWLRELSQYPHVVFQEWVSRLETLGSEIIVSDERGQWTGTAIRVERSGGLRVRLPDGSERTILVGDVSIRSAGGFTTA